MRTQSLDMIIQVIRVHNCIGTYRKCDTWSLHTKKSYKCECVCWRTNCAKGASYELPVPSKLSTSYGMESLTPQSQTYSKNLSCQIHHFTPCTITVQNSMEVGNVHITVLRIFYMPMCTNTCLGCRAQSPQSVRNRKLFGEDSKTLNVRRFQKSIGRIL